MATALKTNQNALQCVACEFDFDKQGGAVGTYNLGVRIPNGAVVVNAFGTCLTAFTSANSTATIAVQTNAANDIFTAAAVSGAPWSTTGQKLAIPDLATVADYKTMTAEREVKLLIAVEAITAGKANFFIFFVNNSVA